MYINYTVKLYHKGNCYPCCFLAGLEMLFRLLLLASVFSAETSNMPSFILQKNGSSVTISKSTVNSTGCYRWSTKIPRHTWICAAGIELSFSTTALADKWLAQAATLATARDKQASHAVVCCPLVAAAVVAAVIVLVTVHSSDLHGSICGGENNWERWQ